jgi:hypothetical protein
MNGDASGGMNGDQNGGMNGEMRGGGPSGGMHRGGHGHGQKSDDVTGATPLQDDSETQLQGDQAA